MIEEDNLSEDDEKNGYLSFYLMFLFFQTKQRQNKDMLIIITDFLWNNF